MLPRVANSCRRDVAKRPRTVFRFPMASDVTLAGVATPERKVGEVSPVRIYLPSVRQSRFYFPLAAAAINHCCTTIVTGVSVHSRAFMQASISWSLRDSLMSRSW